MMERQYRFAGVEIAVSMPEEHFYENEYHLAPFAAAETADPHRFEFTLAESLDPPAGELLVSEPGFRVYSTGEERIRYIGTVRDSWAKGYIRARHRGKEHHVQVKAEAVIDRVGTKTVLNSIEVERLVTRAGGFILHCAYIVADGRAILFTAPSETGKSTQAELWKKYRGAEIVNGDRAAVRIVEGKAMAEGIPFAGSSAYCENRSAPIAAVVYLSKAPRTSIRKMRGYEAFARIWEGVSVFAWDRTDVELASGAVKRLVESVPVYHLACTPDESAVITLEKQVKQ